MADTENQRLGRLGEELASSFLEDNGYKILAKNLHLSKNEIDIIATDDSFLVFVEVKTRSCLYPESGDFGVPGRAVDEKKRGNIVSAARMYLAQNPTQKQPRIDVLEVYMLEEKDSFKTPTVLRINHIRNAFSSRGKKYHC